MTKEQFDLAYSQYPPSKFVKFAFRYFSKETEKKDFKVGNIVTALLLGSFLGGFIGTILGVSKQFIGTFTLLFCIILSILVIGLFIAVKLNNNRIDKIIKVLNLDRLEYNKLVEELYPSK